ncbi:MAG: hypothetical protein ACRCRW_01445 [Aeromonadaceae bacterium]
MKISGHALGSWLMRWESQQLAVEARGQWRSITLLLCGMALLLGVQNPLLYGMTPAFDASLFATMGKMWADGDVLYRDMMDIKGPMIFLFGAIGYKLGGFPGIAVLEIVLLALGLNLGYRALARLGFSPLVRLISLFWVIGLCALRYYYGNMTEDYTLYLGLIASYSFVSLLCEERFSWRHAWLPAFTFGLIAMMRLNNGAFWGACYAAIFLIWVWHRQWRDAWLLFSSALLGLAAVSLPLVLYFHLHGVLENFWFYSFGIFMGKSYGNGFSVAVGAVGLFRTGLIWWLLPALALLHLQYWKSTERAEKNRNLGLALLLALGALFATISNSVSGHIYDHYDQIFFIYLPFALAVCLQALCGCWQEHKLQGRLLALLLPLSALYLLFPHMFFGWTRFEWPMAKVLHDLGLSLLLALLCCLALLALWRPLALGRLLPGLAAWAVLIAPAGVLAYSAWTGAHTGRPFSSETAAEVALIRAQTTPEERIWVDGILPQFYVWCDRKPGSAYLFFDNVTPPFDVKERVLADIQRTRPTFIIIRKKRLAAVTAPDAELTPSQHAFYRYVFSHYEQVKPGIFKLLPSDNEKG